MKIKIGKSIFFFGWITEKQLQEAVVEVLDQRIKSALANQIENVLKIGKEYY